MTTPADVIAVAAKRDIRVTEAAKDVHVPMPVALFWSDDPERNRYPIVTLTWPDPKRPQFNTFAWGHHYEHEAPPGVDADTLVQLVVDSGELDSDA